MQPPSRFLSFTQFPPSCYVACTAPASTDLLPQLYCFNSNQLQQPHHDAHVPLALCHLLSYPHCPSFNLSLAYNIRKKVKVA
ncbi:hypothetical protein VNO80_13282 [Phaseolus coccineus]|uniref:Uncharacterized protein n=1 Tax=Phaseolus coccineus TaxID=3886 RepID=A0AAN9N0N7_PHACN